MSFVVYCLLLILGLVIIYLGLNYKLVKLMDYHFHQKYRLQLHQDIQDFYREMEGYSTVLEGKISSFKNLVIHQKQLLEEWTLLWSKITSTKKGQNLNKVLQKLEEKDSKVERVLADIESKMFSPKSYIEKKSPPKVTYPLKSSMKQSLKNKNNITDDKSKTQSSINIISNQSVEFSEDKDLIEEMIQPDSFYLQKNLVSTHDTVSSSVIEEKKNIQEGKDSNSNIQNNNTQEGESVFISILKNIGSSIAPLVGLTKTSGETQKLAIHSAFTIDTLVDDSVRTSVNVKPFSDIIRDNITAHDKKEHSSSLPKDELSFVDTIQKSMSLNTEEFRNLIDKMRNSEHRVDALRSLLKEGIPLEKISKLSYINLNELELMRRIYNM